MLHTMAVSRNAKVLLYLSFILTFALLFYCGTWRIASNRVAATNSGKKSKYRRHLAIIFARIEAQEANLIFKNWLMKSVRISSYGCKRQVWRARDKRTLASFLSALQTQTSQVHP